MSLNLETLDNYKLNINYSDSAENEEIKTFSAIAHEDDILQVYLKEIGKIKLLKSDEEKSLGKKIKENKDEIAKRKLIQANLRLVVSIAKKIYGAGGIIHGFGTGGFHRINQGS